MKLLYSSRSMCVRGAVGLQTHPQGPPAVETTVESWSGPVGGPHPMLLGP